VRSRVEVITPELATKWLERNENNRDVVQSTVDRYARDMRAGRWLMTGEPIHFGASGRLLNGQHRLWACLEAQVPFESLVVRGLVNEHDVMDVIDTGAKRTLASALQIHGEPASLQLAAIINLCWRYDRDRASYPGYPTHAEGLQYLNDNPGIREAVKVAAPVYRNVKVARAPVGAAYYLNARVDAEAAEEFWRLVASGEGLTSGSPVLAYRRFAIGALAKRDKPGTNTWLAYNLKAMALWRQGRNTRLLSWKQSDGMPDTWS